MHDSDPAGQPLLTISTFARAVGLPASALRHYSAQDVLVPADVDPRSGYRYYAPDQIAQGVLVQRMRAAAVPLPAMREVLAAEGPARLAVLEGLLAEHSTRSAALETGLRTLRDELTGAPSARATLPGPVLAGALRQVLPAAATAAEELAAVVWALGPAGLALMATDRYWLARRLLPAAVEGATAQLVSSPEVARSLAERCARSGMVEVELAPGTITVRRPDGTVLCEAPSAEGSVPDLERLLATQPPARAIIGFDRDQLLDLLASPEPWRGGGGTGPRPRVHLRLDLDARSAALDQLAGWAALEGEDAPAEVLLQATLLRAAVAVCPAGEVLFAVVDAETPLRVLSPSQDALTCLVMPMRA